MIDNMGDFKQEYNQPTQEHQNKEKAQKKHLEFFGRSQNCVVCFVDMINSTKLAAHIPESKLSIFYSVFLNNMANSVEEHEGKIVKSIGDALLFYFDTSCDNYLKNTLRCGLDMIDKRDKINSELHNENLPAINYRVSADFGKVMIGYSAFSAAEDIFGSVVNMCSKINPLAKTNGMVVGNDFQQIAKSLNGFQFKERKTNPSVGLKTKYSIYDVTRI